MGIRDNILLLNQPESEVAERFRGLMVSFFNFGAPRRSFITSFWPADGKSLVAANLAAALAASNRKVLLVDADLRHPTLTNVFDRRKQPGLADLLAGEAPAEEFVASTEIPNLFFLGAGCSEVSAGELLSRHERLEALLAGQEEECFIILDTPPLSVCSDALLVGARSQGGILVFNERSYVGQSEPELLEKLHQHEIPILGAVLNEVSSGGERGYGYGNYRYYKPTSGRKWWERLLGKR